jgi:hypothetical protein
MCELQLDALIAICLFAIYLGCMYCGHLGDNVNRLQDINCYGLVFWKKIVGTNRLPEEDLNEQDR